jgi:DNA replication protein DnaC
MTNIPESSFRLDALDRLANTLETLHNAFSATLDTLDTTRPCKTHAEAVSVLNRDASFTAGEAVYDCPICQTLAKERRLKKRIAAAGIPADVHHATLANFKIDRTNISGESGRVPPAIFLRDCLKFRDQTIRNLLLCGSAGIGKSHLAAALAIAGLKDGQSVAWIECQRLFADYHRAYADSSGWQVIDYFLIVDLFVLDEICFRDLPADGEEILYEIFSKRRIAGRQSILVGNKPAGEVRAWLGQRIADRLKSGGVAFCYGEWDSMRGKEEDGGF